MGAEMVPEIRPRSDLTPWPQPCSMPPQRYRTLGYFLPTSPDRPPASPLASPKTHGPFLPVKERGSRFYSPETGRWINREPVGSPAFNLYFAFQNRPTVIVDRDGKDNVCPPDQNLCCGVCENSCSGACPPPNPAPKPPPSGSCRAILMCKPVAIVAWHCWIVIERSNGSQFACRAGPASKKYGVNGHPPGCCPCDNVWGTIITECGNFGPGFPDYGASGTRPIVIAEGPDVCNAQRCLTKQMGQIENACYRYSETGPNCNTGLYHGLVKCGLPANLPSGVVTPGFNDFYPNDYTCSRPPAVLTPQTGFLP